MHGLKNLVSGQNDKKQCSYGSKDENHFNLDLVIIHKRVPTIIQIYNQERHKM